MCEWMRLRSAQDVEVQRRRLQAFRPAFAQPLEMPVGGVELGFAQLGFFAQQLARRLDVAGHEDAEGGLQALETRLWNAVSSAAPSAEN